MVCVNFIEVFTVLQRAQTHVQCSSNSSIPTSLFVDTISSFIYSPKSFTSCKTMMTFYESGTAIGLGDSIDLSDAVMDSRDLARVLLNDTCDKISNS